MNDQPNRRAIARASLFVPILAVVAPVLLTAGTLVIFSNDTVADANAVNGNFSELAARIAAVEASVDARVGPLETGLAGLTTRVGALETTVSTLETGVTPTQGTVVNVAVAQTRTQALYTAPNSGNGTEVTPLRLSLTPKKAGNRVVLTWVVNGESHNDVVYVVTRNGALLTDTTNAGNNRWAGVTGQPYDGDHNSTMDNAVVQIIDTNSLATASTYELRVRSSSAGTYTLHLNRTMGSTGQDAYEASVSTGTATEIWW